jgi:hypothetical protein
MLGIYTEEMERCQRASLAIHLAMCRNHAQPSHLWRFEIRATLSSNVAM